MKPEPAAPSSAVLPARAGLPLRAWLPNVAVAIGAAALVWRGWRRTGAWPLAPSLVVGFSLALLVLAFAAPRLHAPVQRALETVGRWIAQGFTWLVLLLVFTGVFVPGRVVQWIARADPLGRRRSGAAGTYWRVLPAPPAAAERFRRQF